MFNIGLLLKFDCFYLNIKTMLTSHLRKIFLFLGDVLWLYTALLLTLLLGFWGYLDWQIFLEHLLPFSALYFFWLVIFYAFGFYELHFIRTKFYLYPRILGALFVNFFLGVILFYSLPFFDITPKTNLILNTIITGLLVWLWRVGFWSLFSSHFVTRLAIVAKQKPQTKELKKELLKKPYLGYRLVSTNFKKDLFSQIQAKNIETVVFGQDFEAEPNLLRALYLAGPGKVNFWDFATAFEIICQKIPLSCLDGTGILENLKKGEKLLYNKIKRGFDLTLATLFLLVSLPFWAIIALAVKLEDGGPVFYKQKRTGRAGKEFFLIKFRSMVPEAEKKGPQWAENQDKRATKVGRLLRVSHLDELPQMVNILKGDISLVGPRPERPVFVKDLEKKIPYYNLRHSIKPGFTGWAQIKFRYGRSIQDSQKKLEYDLYYLKNRSLILDIGILLKTFQLLLKRE